MSSFRALLRSPLPPLSDCLLRSAGLSTYRQARLRAILRPSRRGAHARAGRGHSKRWSIGGSDHGDIASLAGDGHACEAGPGHDWRAVTHRKGVSMRAWCSRSPRDCRYTLSAAIGCVFLAVFCAYVDFHFILGASAFCWFQGQVFELAYATFAVVLTPLSLVAPGSLLSQRAVAPHDVARTGSSFTLCGTCCLTPFLLL